MVAHRAAGLGTLAEWALLLPIAALLALYLTAAARQRRAGRPWNVWRTATFSAGLALLAIALSPPLADFAHHDLRGHMAQHLLVGMVAPLGLVLGAPLNLAFRVLPRRASRSLVFFLHSAPIRLLSHPVTALALNIGGMALLYLTPLYNLVRSSPALHLLMHLHFLAAGTLFAWSIAGPVPAPDRPGMRMRLVVLFLSIAAHATLSKLLYIYLLPAGSLHSANEIRSAAQLMYYGGDVAELFLATALFTAWYQKRGRRLVVASLNP
jgi:putative membrane protein